MVQSTSKLGQLVGGVHLGCSRGEVVLKPEVGDLVLVVRVQQGAEVVLEPGELGHL